MLGVNDRYNEEKLSNNTEADYCAQCKKCIHWGKSGTPWDNKHDKSNCEMYPHPGSMKPLGVINNLDPCEYREE